MPTVGEGREGWFMFLFVLQALVWLGLVTWYQVGFLPADNALGASIAIARGMAPLIVVAAADTVVIVEGYEMLAEKYLRRRYEAGRKEGREEGRAEGRVEGREEGREEIHDLWGAWNQRRLEAHAQGTDFTEPPPTRERTEQSK